MRFKNSGVGDRHRALSRWSDLLASSPSPNYEGTLTHVRQFLADADASVLALIGPRGTGKSQIGATAVLETLRTGRTARRVRALAFLDNLRRRFDERGADDWRTEWCVGELLVVDEFNRRADTTGWASVVLEELIDERYEHNRKSILIGNLTSEAFAEYAGDSIVERCNEGGGVLVCAWQSFRDGRELPPAPGDAQ